MIAPLLLCGAPGKVAILLDRSPDWASRQEETAGPCIEMLPRRSWLRRIVLAAALLFVLAAPAAAEEKAGGFSFAVDGRNDTEEAAAGPLYRSWATVGASFTVAGFKASALDRKSTRLNSSHVSESRMPASA